MHVIEVPRFGGPEVLVPTDAPQPSAGDGQVVVAAEFCDVMFVDTLIRSGRGVDYFPFRPPYVPGGGMAGQVVAVGAGVERSWVGRRVIAHTGGTGGYAEAAVVPRAGVAEVPDDVQLAEAAAILHDGPTALQVTDLIGIPPGAWVVILGAAGGMGILLVQLARSLGARVVGAARGKAKLAAIEDAGADAVVDYGFADWTDQILEITGSTGPEVVLDGAGGTLGRDAYGIMADGGRYSGHGTASGSFAPIDPDDARRRGITVFRIGDYQFGPDRRAALMLRSLAALQSRELRPLIGQTYPLKDAAEAHAGMEARQSVAKTLLQA